MYLYQNSSAINEQFIYNFNGSINVPQKVLSIFNRKVSKTDMNNISPNNFQFAYDSCMYFIFLLSINRKRLYKKISSKQLSKIFTKDGNQYKRIIDLLKSNKVGVIEENSDYKKNTYSKSFRLVPSVWDSKNVVVLLKSELVTKINQNRINQYIKAIENPIANNCLIVREMVELPSNEEIIRHAKKLIKQDFKHKGKALVFNKNAKENTIIVENSLLTFDRLKNANLIPKIGNHRSGGRVVDTFTLMPSWMRSLIKLNDNKIVQLDYNCLHPNLAMSIYGGSSKFITHKMVADELDLPIHEVKTLHLSFFNALPWQMKLSKIYCYYSKNEPELLNRILHEKANSKYKHKITSQRLFSLEVLIMTAVITKLNALNIFVIYVYDAIFCEEKYLDVCRDIMNQTVLEFGVFTLAQ